MWQQAAVWREDDPPSRESTIFDRAAGRIEHEARHRSVLDVVELLELAELQRLEHDEQAPANGPGYARLAHDVDGDANSQVASASDVRFDDPRRRQHLQDRLRAAGVPEQAVEAARSPTPGKPASQRDHGLALGTLALKLGGGVH